MITKLGVCPDTGLPTYQDNSGVVRKLACLPPAVGSKARFQRASDVIPVIDPSTYKPVVHNLDPSLFILDQQQHGSCVGFSAAGALMRSRALRGYQYQKLSGSYIYSWINGGFDGGASIPDALTELEQHGTCLDATCSVNMIYRSQSSVGDQEAGRFKLDAGLTIDTIQELQNSLQAGFICQIGVNVGYNFENFDSEGAAGYTGGSNHSVCIGGMELCKDGKTWKYPLFNSWGLSFGPFGDGHCYIYDRHFLGGGGGFTHIDPTTDPNNPIPVPNG